MSIGGVKADEPVVDNRRPGYKRWNPLPAALLFLAVLWFVSKLNAIEVKIESLRAELKQCVDSQHDKLIEVKELGGTCPRPKGPCGTFAPWSEKECACVSSPVRFYNTQTGMYAGLE